MKLTVTEDASVFEEIAGWIRDRDAHAEHHLALIDQAEAALAAGRRGDASSRELGERIERWRYQYLHEHAVELTWQDETLVDALDGLANRLAGRPSRPPRSTGRAIRDASLDTDSMREAIEMTDPCFPIERLIDRARSLTRRNFATAGTDETAVASSLPARHRMLVYAPLYVSNECVNYCTYCGFRYPLDIARRHLSCDEAMEQVRLLRGRGFRHVLVVGGDFPRLTTTGYYAEIIRAMVAEDVVPAVEIAPQTTQSYAALAAAGACGVTLYQETYDEGRYREYHERGPKSSYHWRLESHDRAAEGGMARLGLGVLLGLSDPRRDVPAMMRHGAYLRDRFPDRTLAFSLPRIHAAPDGFHVPFPVGDESLIRWYCALRVTFPRAELVLSTRESASLRNRLADICITQMSAGSSTAPGGYDEGEEHSGEQFPVSDHRSVAEVARWLDDNGFRAVWSLDKA
ncbi:MAG: radical SAM protein [Pirellulaceae bacterium]|nr:radical SAM protein [Pirellulaceae bacterium]